MTIGKKIKYLREHRGMTQAELAEATGIHPVSIRKYETDKMTPQREQLERLSKALDVQIEDWVDEYIYRLPFHDNGHQTLALLYNLYMNDFIKIKGKRLNDGLLDKSTVKIMLNANVGKLLKVFQKDNAIDMNHLEIRPEKELLDMFLVLEKGIYNLEQTSTSVEISDVDDLKNEEDYLKASEQLSDDCAMKILDMALLKSEAGLVPDPFVRKGESVVIVDSSRKIPSLETILDNKK